MSKMLPFVKMSGAGNDFIIIEKAPQGNLKTLTRRICDRTSGIGADGLMILSRSRKTDYKMRIINADGSEAEMCGNGARCMAAYIVKHKKMRKKVFGMETIAGVILAQAKGEVANVRLSDPKDFVAGVKVKIGQRKISPAFIDTGVPHTVVAVEDLEEIDVFSIGRTIRYDKAFAPKGTNVNFYQQFSGNLIGVRTYERGVEDETRACGTGSVASALIAYQRMHENKKSVFGGNMRVKTRNGDVLSVSFDMNDGHFTNVWLKGPARFVAEGKYYC